MTSSCPRGWTRFLCTSLMIVIATCILTRAQTQAPQASDVQQLRDKLLQLEQEMNALKGQINAIEQPTQSASLTIPSAASSDAPAPGRPPKPQKEDEPKSNIDLYGFIMLDSGYDFKTNNPDWFDVIRPTKLPSFSGEFAPDGKAYFGVRQTRFGVKTSTPTRLGTLKTQFEFELFGTEVDAGQTTFRLRHAYGELGKFGAGQTWSPFMDIDAFPNSIEYWGPTGMVFFRNIQVRWMPIRSDNTRLTFAVERPGASADQGVYADRVELQGVKPKLDMPDFSSEAPADSGAGVTQGSEAYSERSRWVDTNPTDAVDLSGDAFGWGVNFSSNLKFGKDTIGRFMVV